MFAVYIFRSLFGNVFLMDNVFFHVHSVGVGSDLSCSYPRNSLKWCCVFPLLASQFVIFCIPKWVVFVDDAGTMNRPLRLAVCSLPYICAKNEYCGMFVAIHFV